MGRNLHWSIIIAALFAQREIVVASRHIAEMLTPSDAMARL
jgi:hypothetical protein